MLPLPRLTCAFFLLIAFLAAKSPANPLAAQAQAAELRQDWDTALALYSQALATNPAEITYRMAVARCRFQAGQAHLRNGVHLRSEGRLEDALAQFERARAIDAGSVVAGQEIAATRDMIARKSLTAPEELGLTPVEQMRRQRAHTPSHIASPPQLDPPVRTPVSIRMVNQPSKILFETVARYAGLSILFDPEYQPAKISAFEATDATVENTLDNLALLSKSFWKPISSNTIFVTNDNPNKRRDYEDQVTRVFYLSSVSGQQEVTDIVNVVRSVVDLQKVLPYLSQYAIVARGEADKILLAEKLIHDLDKPRSEVVVDILVLEAGKVFSRQVTTAIASTGLNVPVNFSPRSSMQATTTSASSSSDSSSTSSTTSTTTSSSTTSTAIPVSALGHLASSDFSITLPSALLQAALSDADTRILQAPQLRAVDNVKATLKIGDRTPTASGSFQAGTSTTTVNALVNTQFTYIDVGVNVELTSRVHDDGEVSMHLEVEISNVNGYVNLGGINEPVIGQRKIVHDIRMREGEVGLIAGLANQQDTKSVTGIPGLSSIPVIRRLFTGESINRSRSDLMIAIVPHIVRRPEFTPDNLRGIASGTASTIKLSTQ
jgi:general secretion pathway protein D